MATKLHLRQLARARIRDAEILFAGRRYDGAYYLCGYSVETILKARICSMLHWPEYLVSRDYASFRTHDLGVLLNLTGQKEEIQANYGIDWSIVSQWTPERRYEPIGSVKRIDAERMITSAERLLVVL